MLGDIRRIWQWDFLIPSLPSSPSQAFCRKGEDVEKELDLNLAAEDQRISWDLAKLYRKLEEQERCQEVLRQMDDQRISESLRPPFNSANDR